MKLIRTDYGRAKYTIALEFNEDIVKEINAVLSNYVYRGSEEETVNVNLEEVESIAKYITYMPNKIDEDTYKVEICRKSDFVNNAHFTFWHYLGDVVNNLLNNYLCDSYDYDYDFDCEVSDYWVE